MRSRPTLKTALGALRDLWCVTRFGSGGMNRYAQGLMLGETRRGVMTMSLLLLLVLASALAFYQTLGAGRPFLYTGALLAALALHIFISANGVRDLRGLHLLGITLLVVSATGLALVAHQTGALNRLLLGSAVLLFMIVPMVPWGLREAGAAVAVIYVVLSLSTLTAPNPFAPESLWTLQFFMLGAGAIALTMVALNTRVRRDDIHARFRLEQAHERLTHLSNVDPLTEAWNRRYIPHAVNGLRVRHASQPDTLLHLAVMDVDRFKHINDSHGHGAGDRVLQLISRVLRRHLGENGYLIRMGGDEFAAVYVAGDATRLMQQAVGELENSTVTGVENQDTISVAVSFGLASAPLGDLDGIDFLYRTADARLYKVKQERHRRYRTRHAGSPPPGQPPGASIIGGPGERRPHARTDTMP